MTSKRRKGEARRSAKDRVDRWASGDSYGHLFEPGRQDELRRVLSAKVYEIVAAPDRGAMQGIVRTIDNVVKERNGGWHFRLSTERLFRRVPHADDASARLCADCALPGCCYFEIVRLTSDDVQRLSSRLKLSSQEFVSRHCSQLEGAEDRRYTHALKKTEPCEFLEDNRCRVYADRPTVCADFPLVVDPNTGDVIEIRLFPFCNLPFNLVRQEVTRRVLEGSRQDGHKKRVGADHTNSDC